MTSGLDGVYPKGLMLGSVLKVTKKSYGVLAVSKNVIAGVHLWRERRLLRPGIFFSDDLQADITRSGLRIFRHHQLKAI